MNKSFSFLAKGIMAMRILTRALPTIASMVLIAAMISPDHIHAQSIDNLKIIKLSPSEGEAVISLDAGKISTIHIGDMVNDNFKLTDLSENWTVLDNTKSDIGEKIIIRMENGKQRIERLTVLPEPSPHQYQIIKETVKTEK